MAQGVFFHESKKKQIGIPVKTECCPSLKNESNPEIVFYKRAVTSPGGVLLSMRRIS